MTTSPVPSISTELLTTADGDLNRELHHFLFDPPSNPELLKGKTIAICCTNGVEEVEILGAQRWLTEHHPKNTKSTLQALQSFGGYCDCEVLTNVVTG